MRALAFKTKFLSLIFLLFQVGCGSKLSIKNLKPASGPNVTSVDKIAALAGEEIAVKGTGFKEGMIAKVGDADAALVVKSSSLASLTMPSNVSKGLVDLKFHYTDRLLATFQLFSGDLTEASLVSTPAAADVCSDIIYKNEQGELVRGERNCALQACTAEGQEDCAATAEFPTVEKASIAAKLPVGETLAGVAGTKPARPLDCSVDGALGCVTVADFPAVDKINALQANAANLKAGTSIAGVVGTLSDCSTDGSSNCIADGTVTKAALLSSFTAADVRSTVTIAGVAGSLGGLSPCSTDGATLCVANAAFPAVDKVNVLQANAALISDTLTIATVPGSLPACLSEGGIDCIASSTFPAVDKANTLTANAAKIRSGLTIAGVAGTLANCAADGSQNCYSTGSYFSATACTANSSTCYIPAYNGTGQNYKAIDFTSITPAVVKDGVTIAGVAGNFPSSTYPLTVSDGISDLDAATFNAKIKSSADFGWFDRNGLRITHAGDADILDANIKTGVSIFGTTGNGGGADCAADGVVGCLTTSRYKSMDTDTSVITGWDIRAGKSAGGIAGLFTLYKNGIVLTTYDRSTGTGGISGADIFDTIDDRNNNLTPMPTDVSASFPSAGSASNWVRDPASDLGTGGGVASDGICNGSEECVYMDRITNLYWSPASSTQYTYETAITYCDGLTHGTYTDWRSPTQKELNQFFIDGGYGLKASNKLNYNYTGFWSSTTVSNNNADGWSVEPNLYNGSGSKTGNKLVFCVR